MVETQYRVLVIDDEESMRDSCSLILAKDGFVTDTAENGNIGLQKIQEQHPDFVIIDLKMPGIGGLDVLDRVREINPNIIPIVITGYATVESAVEAMKRGAYDFLPKPFTPEELRLIIRRGIERKQLQQEAETLRREKKLIEENFITMVSHQLRSPLVAVAQYFEVILGGHVGEIGPQLETMVQRAKSRLEGLLELINDWLSIARMNGGRLVDKLKPIHLGPMLAKLIDFFQALTEEKEVTLTLESPEGHDLALADAESLEQVFVNLITNAIKYNKPGGSVQALIREEGDTVVVEVKDSGVGIAPEHLPFVFDQFYQIDRSKRSGDKGSGLGLTIAKKVVEAHNGSIQVASEPGTGSTFTVRLPKAVPV
jgi:signal transduction histidine kinase